MTNGSIFARRLEEAEQVTAETDTWFCGGAVGVRIESAKKYFNLFRNLLIAVKDALTWLHVMLRFRLHLHTPTTCPATTEVATLWFNLTLAGVESFRLMK